jgi:hypothetical protein
MYITGDGETKPPGPGAGEEGSGTPPWQARDDGNLTTVVDPMPVTGGSPGSDPVDDTAGGTDSEPGSESGSSPGSEPVDDTVAVPDKDAELEPWVPLPDAEDSRQYCGWPALLLLLASGLYPQHTSTFPVLRTLMPCLPSCQAGDLLRKACTALPLLPAGGDCVDQGDGNNCVACAGPGTADTTAPCDSMCPIAVSTGFACRACTDEDMDCNCAVGQTWRNDLKPKQCGGWPGGCPGVAPAARGCTAASRARLHRRQLRAATPTPADRARASASTEQPAAARTAG